MNSLPQRADGLTPNRLLKVFAPSGGVWVRIFALAIVSVVLAACERAPHSNPTALRNTNNYAEAISPQVPGELNLQALEQVQVNQDGQSLVVTMPRLAPNDSNDGFGHRVKYLKAGEKLEGDGASFEMVAFATSGPGISKTNQDKTIALACFDPQGRALSPEELKARGFNKWERSDWNVGASGGIDDSFPKLRVSFGSIKQPPGYCSFVGLFDARTKQPLVSGSSYSGIAKGQLGHVTVNPHAWHATPMEMVVDVELDGRTVVETNAVPGMQIAVPGGAVRLLGIWDGRVNSWSSQTGWGTNPATMRLSLQQREGETNSVAILVTEPPKLAVHVELLDSAGREISGSGGNSGSGVRTMGLRCVAGDVKRVRFSVFTNHYRVVCELPPIPNLPGGGGAVSNLFEVRIPQVQISREYEWRQLIGAVAQMDFGYPPMGDAMPVSFFPLTFTNITPAQLMVEYERHMTNGYGVVVDEQKNEIRVEPTRFEKAKRWLMRLLRI